ncbi:serine carboxypeptidase-like 50 [Actinidia eriantha]|uniref:serine carboxypeptidase-like 50 n=1 Tax=Actinidia eriantha TaxID=165200 RepID=UPI002584DC0E|nr:serine carboxypeptidase-like 50 [Actinidia eriantha]
MPMFSLQNHKFLFVSNNEPTTLPMSRQSAQQSPTQMESTPVVLGPRNCLKLLLFVLHILIISAATDLLPTEALPTKSGYLPVNQTTNSAIFYTFYEAQTPMISSSSGLSQIPLLIWLQGGPGCSSMLGNFYELGPWRISRTQNGRHLTLQPNSGSWNRLFGLLFLDNPIGVGFSIASTPQDIPTNQHTVSKHLFAAITAFVALDPQLFKSRPIYITGESYAGKYVPAIGYYIVKKNAHLPASKQLNLGGVAIGNGLTDPVTQVATHAANAYFSGLINEKQKTQLEKLQNEAVQLTKNANWSLATDSRNALLNFLQSMTGLATLYDYRRQIPYETSLVTEFLSQSEVKKSLGVNESMVYEECSDVVGAVLHADVMKSVKYMVEFLVKNSKVMLYQGFCDLRDGVVSTEAWVRKMKWEGIDKFMEAERKVWRVNGELAGYVQKWANLSHVVVLAAGHLVPTDQPLNSQAMVEDWVLERGVFANQQVHNPSLDLQGVI